MNWSLIIFGLVALTSVTFAKDSYLVIVPKLFKVDYDNQLSIFIASAAQPVEVKFDFILGSKRLEQKVVCKPGETRNATLTLPKEFPIGAGELIITGTGGLQFEEKRDVIVYDSRHVLLVQTSASTYRPHDTMEIRVIATTEELMPIESDEINIEIYDAALKLVGEFPRVPIRSGLTETLRFPIGEDVNLGGWLVSATIDNTTSSIQVIVSRPVTPSFDLKAIFQRFLLRTDKFLRGVIEIADDDNTPIFGRAIVSIGQVTEQEFEMTMKSQARKEEPTKSEEWRKWKSQKFEIAGRIELNYDLLSLFEIDISKALAIQIYIQVTDLQTGQERVIRHLIPVFTRDIIYEIRPLEFEAGMKNEYTVTAKRPDGKPIQMENMIVNVRMILRGEKDQEQEEKIVEIKDFYTRGRNDMGFFNMEFPENCIGVLMTVTPVGEDGKIHGYRTVTIPLMPTPRRNGAKLSIELLPSTVAPVNTDVNVPVVSSQISTVDRVSNFYIQLIPSKPVEKFEPLLMSYVLMTNGRITLTGEFHIKPTKECQIKTKRALRPEEQMPLTCVFNGTLPIYITRDMVPYSTLLVYAFQPSFGFNVAETYRFSVAGLFQSSLTLNATIVPFTSTETVVDNFKFVPEMNTKPIVISDKVQDKTRVELSFTGVPESTVGLNVFEFDGILQGLSNEVTKERLLRYLTSYEHVPLVSMPTMPSGESVVRAQRQMPPNGDMSGQNSAFQGPMGGAQGPMNGGQGPMNGGQGPMGGAQGPMGGAQGPMGGAQGPMGGAQGPMNGGQGPMGGAPQNSAFARRTISEADEDEQARLERVGYEARYPVEKMIFGVHTDHTLLPVEGDDIYVSSKMGRIYGDMPNEESTSSEFDRQLDRTINQFDVSVHNDDFVIATSMPLVFATEPKTKPIPRKPEQDMNVEKETLSSQSTEYGTRKWYERMSSRLNSFSQEAFKFMQSGLSIVSDFDSLRVPVEMKRENLTKLFSKFRQESLTVLERSSFNIRDEARDLLEQYISQYGLSMMIPPVMLEEQSRIGYYRSIFFNTSRIESQGTGKVVLPRTKPYSTWLATGFALNSKSGLSIAQPIRLPTNQGLFVLADCEKYGRVGEHMLFTYGINNYLEKDLTNVIFRIRASPDFELIEQSKPDVVVSSKDKDYTLTIPSLKTFGVETRSLVLIPKRCGLLQIVLEVESEFGGDYEILTLFVREPLIERKEITARLFDLTGEKKTYGPIVEKIVEPTNLRAVRVSASGSFLERFFKKYTMSTAALVGIDRALVRLYRSLALRRYYNETLQTESVYFNMTAENITAAYQELQFYNDYNGSFSFIADDRSRHPSLYLTSLAFGAMISPMMPFRDNVTLNRTLNWILSHQHEDGSFEDNGACFHYQFCAGEFRRESLTAIVLYSLTRDNSSDCMPEFIRRRLFEGENSPVMRAHRYLVSRVPDVKSHIIPITLIELAFIQDRHISTDLRQKIHDTLITRKLTVVPEDNSKYWKNVDDKMTISDELLINSMTISLYAYYNDYRTAFDMARWAVKQLTIHPQYDTILDAIFFSEVSTRLSCLFRKQFEMDKVAVTIDMAADNGEKQQFKIDSKNFDAIQIFHITLPVREITYSVHGFGIAGVSIVKIFADKEQQKPIEPMPFKLTQEFQPKNWLNEILAKTCLTYTPTTEAQRLAKDTFNRTIVIDIELPSGMRVNERQIGFFLSRVENVQYFRYDRCLNKLSLFINVPSTIYGKDICMEWCLERLSTVVNWSPISIRVYDYLQPTTTLFRLVSIQFQPSLLGYSFVEKVHESRPKLDSLTLLNKPKQA
ncbi:hypothetical protein I4U23_000414 [Adineta vaga]|nr:hypothetical protein I4U23_000414 [Adineta vaga]